MDFSWVSPLGLKLENWGKEAFIIEASASWDLEMEDTALRLPRWASTWIAFLQRALSERENRLVWI